MDDKELEKLATKELLKEAERGKIRAEQAGALGWQACPLPKVNRRFVGNMLMGTVSERRRLEERKNGRTRRRGDTLESYKRTRKRQTTANGPHAQYESTTDGKRSRKFIDAPGKERKRYSRDGGVTKRKASKHSLLIVPENTVTK